MDRTLFAEARVIAARLGRGQGDVAEDLAQDLVVAVLEAPAAARRPGAWLERVGRNAAIDRWRVQRRREELAPQIEAPVAPLDPEAALLGRERRGLVRRALAALPRPQRRAALARFHAELPFEAVAARIGTPPVTARTRVHRALASLRARLGGLQAMFVAPGVHATALGLTLIVAGAPGLSPPTGAREPAATPTAVRSPRPSQLAAHSIAAVEAAPSKPALAPPPARDAHPAKAPAPPEPVAPIPAAQVFVFGDDTLEGNTVGPEGERIIVVPPIKHASLIELRRHFVAEVVKSMEEL